MEYASECMRYEWREAHKVGFFPETHQYDLTSAYPAVIARLPDTNNCQCEYAVTRPDWSTWGIQYGTVTVNADVSPLIFESPDGNRINPRGTWEGYFTTRETDFLKRYGIGDFRLRDGWFFRFGPNRPYKTAMAWVWDKRNSPDNTISTIGKRMGQGLSGKLDEDRDDGTYGSFYNSILACMVRSETRIAVADFIYSNNLDVLAVLVDSVLSLNHVSVSQLRAPGTWRYEGQQSAIVLSKGGIWRPGKRPHGVAYEDLLRAFQEHVDESYYEVGGRSFDLKLDSYTTDRVFDTFPQTGNDVLTKTYSSSAIPIA
jgi:hypothetical protein